MFGGEIELMENFEEKMRSKTFLKCVWLGGKENKLWSSSVFFLGSLESFLSKMERKLKGKNGAA